MTLFLIVAYVYLPFQIPDRSGYYIESENVVFIYHGNASHSVFVSGNFNDWCSGCKKWKMTIDTNSGKWILSIAKKELKDMGRKFYEFTFRVDGQLIDADKDHRDTIHCTGYGYRYVIKNL